LTINPYEAPSAAVSDYQPPDAGVAGFSLDPQARPAGQGWDWFRQGWGLFSQAPGLWIGIYLVLMGIMFGVALFPIVGTIAQNLLFPILGAGVMVGCDALRRGQPLEFAHLFAGFSRNSGQLVVLGVLYSVGVLVVLLIAFVPTIGLIGGLALFGAGDPEVLINSIGMPILIGILLWVALLLPLVMAIWFAPALVILHDLPAIEAMRASFFGCLRNWLPFLVYSLVGLGLAVLATLPLLLGWLVLMPWMATSNYCAFREIYYRD